MPKRAESLPLTAERVAALAELIQALSRAPDAVTVERLIQKALRRCFPLATAAHLHGLAGGDASADGPLSRGAASAVKAALQRRTGEGSARIVTLPRVNGTTEALLAVAPVDDAEAGGDRTSLTHGAAAGALALTLPPASEWTEEDGAWLSLLAQQAGMGLAQARLRAAQAEADQRYQEMSEAIEARAQARLEQLTGRGRQLEVLFQLSSQISMTLDEARVTAMALDHLVALTGSRFGFVAMVGPTHDLELGCVRGLKESELQTLRPHLAAGLRLLAAPVVNSRHPMRQNQGTELPPGAAGETLRLDSLLAVPLPSGARTLGALVLVGRLPGYDEADERLVSMFGFQVAVAVQNARMVAKIEGSLQTRRRELDSLSRMAQDLAAAADEAQVLQRVVALIHETFDTRATWVMLGDERTTALKLQTYHGIGREALADELRREGQGVVGEALRALQPRFRSFVDEPAASGGPPAALETMLCVPLLVQKRVLGVLGIDSTRFSAQRPPRQQDLDLIQAFASQAAVAMENARLMGAAVRHTRQERLLNEITDAVRESMDVGAILDRAVERLGAALEVSRCIALLPEKHGEYREHLWTEPGFALPPDEILWESCPIVRRLEEAGPPLVLPDATSMPELCNPPDGAAPPLSLLGIAAMHGGEPKALFMFHQCDRPREWSEDDLTLAQRVVAQVAVAVENAHLYSQELKQEQFQRTMAEIASAVGSSVELTQVLRAVGEQGMRLLGADAAYVWRLDPASRELVSAVAVGHKADRFANLRLPLTRRSFHVVRAATERRPIAAHGVGLDRQANQRLNRMFDCQSLLVVPLIVRQEVFGVVQFSAAAAGARFDDDQVAKAEILVSQAAAAVENAQLYEAEHDRAQDLEVLWRIGQEIAEKLEPERIYRSIAAGARQVLHVDAVSLMMFGTDDETLAVAAQEGLSAEHARLRFRRADGIPRCIAVDGAHRTTLNLAQDPRLPSVIGQAGFQSMLSVPMQDGTRFAGALNVYSQRRRHFRVEEAQKLDLLASFAMTALQQAQQFEREQKIAQAFQRDLLPEPKSRIAGLDMAQGSIAALPTEADVGGDFYDVHAISDTKVGLVIGDVSGKGLAAAPRMAMVKCVLRAFAFEAPSPGQVLERLNRLLFRTVEGEQFVTLFYGVLDVEKGELTYANAGHELPLMLRRDSGAPDFLETTGPLLGVDGASCYREVRTRLRKGDTLVLYTDGFTEARDGNEFLQVEGLASLLDPYREATADAMVRGISQSVEDRYGSLRDDATIMVVKSLAD